MTGKGATWHAATPAEPGLPGGALSLLNVYGVIACALSWSAGAHDEGGNATRRAKTQGETAPVVRRKGTGSTKYETFKFSCV